MSELEERDVCACIAATTVVDGRCAACGFLRDWEDSARAQAAAAAAEIIRVGDYLVNEATGEILGLARDAVDIHVAEEEGPIATVPTFQVRDRESAEWVLEKLFEAETELAAIEKRREILNANLDAMGAEPARRVVWLRKRFEAELEEWAKHELEGAKTRSIRTPFGTLSFRKRKRRLVVRDEDVAAKWGSMRADAGAIVKVTRKLLVSALPDSETIADLVEESEAMRDLTGLGVVPAGDSFTIKTGA